MSEVKWEGAAELRPFLVPVDSLVAFPENPRRDEQQVYAIAKSLRAYGQVRPVCTWENATEFKLPENTVVAGHHVWLAAMSDTLGWSHVAVVPAPFESYEKAKDYLALDNLLTQRNYQETGDQQSLLSDSDLWSSPFEMKVADLKLHERSARKDPEQAIEHLVAQLREFGWADQEVVVAKDGTILAGESVMRAAALAGLDRIPVRKVDIDPDSAQALQIMASDYAIGKRAMVDERAYTELLKQIQEEVGTLEGTGYDPEMLHLLILQSRPATEIRDINEAAEWAGLAEYSPVKLPVKHIISFEDEATREEFFTKANAAGLELGTIKTTIGTTSGWWPHRERQDPGSLRFKDSGREKAKA